MTCPKTDRIGRFLTAFPAAGRSETVHALEDVEGRRSVCGRDASGWLDGGAQTAGHFQDSAYSCRRCLAAMADN